MSKTREPLLVNALEAARLLGVSRAHWYRMRNAGKIPLPVLLGGTVRWRLDELEAWIDAGMPNLLRWNAILVNEEGGSS